MTATEFRQTIEQRIDVLRSLERRAQQAERLNLRVTGWVITEAEALAIRVWRECLVSGPAMPKPYAKVRKIIPAR